ncbi:TauD/TfdA family dioxygenase [Streptomyces sp. WI04-05B]|uniref:TauD/TfdA family dioxygenase n=1 Tax=Streptomyces TaxID=1883 RepID=UPI0029A2B811|nr:MULTISPECIES: TauD/TfdA family dioxygenase [unclassified Streptomyces]MDX2547301.1 TauD/TfdA family dioxygenase [Streptomyces sp. WI04-05B]MDX2589789.1 TauD/TfdA family dioxygenase [Streptomyces sp. WI04-05A]
MSPTMTTWAPKLIGSAEAGVDASPEGLAEFLRGTDLGDLLVREKAVVLRGFAVTQDSYDPLADLLLPDRLAYVHGNSPRTKVGRNLYTSTEYPAEYEISMHNEMSYAASWPSRILFHCAIAAETGGATPVVDGQLWLRSLDAEVREAFAGGVRYTQNLHDGVGFGKSWQDTFETDDRAVVEEFLAGTGADHEWLADGSLRVSQVRPATLTHPVTGTEVWFNQADQFHPAGLGDDAAALAAVIPEDELPQRAVFADGSPILDAHVRHVQETGMRLAIDVDWQEGDLLFVDNVAVAHGRRAYTGRRRILVAMSG